MRLIRTNLAYGQVQVVSEFVGRNKLNNLGSTALRSIREYFQNKLVLKLTFIHMARVIDFAPKLQDLIQKGFEATASLQTREAMPIRP